MKSAMLMAMFSERCGGFAKLIVWGAAIAIVQAAVVSGAASAASDARAYRAFVRDLWPAARSRGIPKQLYDRAFQGLEPDPEVIALNNRQPEFFMPASQYLSLQVTDARIAEGHRKLAAYRSALEAMERRYGVDRHVLLAIWGMETGFGQILGRRNVIRSLSTLGYKGRRQEFGRKQLLAALKILHAGDIGLSRMTGSWAGAMGHTQFIPTSYLAYAVDYTGDGRRDIWDTPADALASTANYLRKAGWRSGRPWGYEVELPRGFDLSLAGRDRTRSVRRWADLGVARVDGAEWSRSGDKAYLYLPGGAHGPTFLVLDNFRAIMRYNVSEKYALAVSHLADRIRGAGPFSRPWPDDVQPISRNEIEEVQRLLSAQGYAVGEIDGVLGSRTRAAVRAAQKENGLTADGFPRPRLIELLRARNGKVPR